MKTNPNHPRKGSSISVEPIRRLEDVANIKRLLASNPRDLLLFTIGVNSSLRISDILKLRVGDIKDLKIGEVFLLREQRSGKENTLFINRSVHKTLRAYLQNQRIQDHHYLFRSRKGDNSPLTIGSVNSLVKSWTKAINLPGNYGAHSLRKTFGYIQRTHYGIGLDILSSRFNHSSPAITRRYLGITENTASSFIMNEI